MSIDNKLIFENSKNLNILYVEDDELLRVSTARLLSNFFNHIETAVDGQDAYDKYLKYFEEHNLFYDIVMTDINMPKLNGLDLVKKIKHLNNEQVTIVITAFNEKKYLKSAINLSIDEFILKPIEYDELKNALYTTSQLVAEKKLIEHYYNDIEEKNILGIDLVDARNFNYATDIVQDLIENKEHISKLWTEKVMIKECLEKHTIDVEYFRKHYAIKVIEYFLNVIQGNEKIGNCPVIFVMLDFFKNKELPLDDIFMICVLFKNSITAYIFDKYSFNHQLFDDISYILDKNFEGVIVNYLKLKGCKEQPIIQKSIEQKIIINDNEIVEYKGEVTNYVEYVIEHDIYELQDLEEDIDSLAISVTESKKATIEDYIKLGEQIHSYGSILQNYPIFTKLGTSIAKLGINLTDNAQILFDDTNKMSNIVALIEGFVNDLIVWRKEIFENNIENPYFLDSSFFSNVDTIIMFIEYDETQATEEEFDDDGMEFF